MKSCVRLLFVVSAFLPLASCDKPLPPAAAAPVAAETDNQLAEARDALQRQALEIETKTALMDKQLVEMAQSLKDRDNAELRSSLDALKQQNEALRVQAEAARQQSNAITQRIAVAPRQNVAPKPVALPDYSLFYDRLEPYGRWFEVNGYGYCWRPTITVAGWRPYVDGSWVWSSHGWAWQTNEPFGWATYHYGRWVNLARYGWIWVPGSDWAPAWVAWRQSRDCVGWAPLPPDQGVCNGVYRDCDSRYGLGPNSYTFINTNQFVSSSYINVYAPVTRQTTIFQHSVNVTQIVPSHSQGHGFVHQGGPPRGQMEQACGQPVPQCQVRTMHADQMPERPQHHWRRDAAAPVAMVDLPAVAPGDQMKRPEIKERIQKPVLMGGFEGVPQQAAREIRENIAQEKETAAVQQQPPMSGHMQHAPSQRAVEPPTVANAPPAVPGAPPMETVNPASAAEKPGVAPAVVPVETATVQQQPGQGSLPQGSRRHSPEGQPATNLPTEETVRPAVAVEPGVDAAREPRRHGQPGMGAPQAPNVPPESKIVENSTPAAAPSTPSVMPAVVENKAPEPSAAAVVPVVEPERTAPPAVMPQAPSTPIVSQQPVAAEAERTRMHAGREQAQAAAMEQRQQKEMQERGQAEKKAAEQAVLNAEAEKNRMQAAASQQEAQQQRMASDQATADTEKARQQAAANAAQQQQEMAAQQQRATAERMAAEQATVAEAERVRQQTEAVAMQQRQQEEVARRAAEEQQIKAQQETERRAQEMAQRQAEEQTRRQQEAEMQRAQEQARRAAEEQQMRAQQEAAQRAQEMAQRQAEEQARRQQEAEMQRAQEQARRAAEEQQMRAQQEAAQRAQEMAQRQAEEQARRAQEEAQRAAAEAARNQPQPAPGS